MNENRPKKTPYPAELLLDDVEVVIKRSRL